MHGSGSWPPQQPALTVGDALRSAPRPRPLLLPAIALAAGIWLSDQVGVMAPASRTAVGLAPSLGLALFLLCLWRGAGRTMLVSLAAAVALAAGFARHQGLSDRPPQHLVHALGEEPVLTRISGRIVTPPIERPALKLNPFLPFDPAPRTQFVLAVDALRTSDPPAAASGNLRVNIEADGLDLRLGQRVEVTGRLWRLFGPRNPGETDWSRWYRQQGIDAGLTVPGAAHLAVLPDPIAWPHRLVNGLRCRAQSLLYPGLFSAPWKGACLQWETIPTRQLSLQPVAIGAVVEVTKRLKPSV